MGTRRPSKADIRRRISQHQQEPPFPPIDDAVAAAIDAYAPRDLDEQTWQAVRPFVVDTARRYAPEGVESCRDRLTALASYASWARERGYELSRQSLLDVEHIEAFTEAADLGKWAAANYRSRLRGITAKLNPAGTGVATPKTLEHQAVKAPYSAREVAAIVRIASTQPSKTLGRQMRVCVGLGLGAGLDSVDIKPLRGRHLVDRGDDGIRVEVPGSRARAVWVRRDFETLVREGLEAITPGRLLLGKDAARRNVAASIFKNAAIHGNAPRFEQSRMRTTWLAMLLGDGVPLPVIMDAAGLRSARTLTDLLPPPGVGRGSCPAAARR